MSTGKREKSTEIQSKIRRIRGLPTLPPFVRKISEMVESDRVSAEKIGKTIGQDYALAAKVLHLVNSPFYGLGGRVSSVTSAVILLGFNVVRGLADTLIRAKNFGFGGDPWVPEINKEAWSLLGLSMQELEEVVFKISEEIFNIDGLDWHDDKQA